MVEDVSAAGAKARADGLPTAEKLEEIQAQAYKESREAGFIKGHEEGMAAGEHEIRQQLQLLESLLHTLAKPLDELDQVVEDELVSLAIAIARQLVRRELKTDPGEVVGVVHEALAALPVASQNIRVSLHPEDVLLMNESVTQVDKDRNWALTEDPGLNRGDCIIHTDVSRVDATLERRLAAVVSQLLGGERKQDAPVQDAPLQETPPKET